MQSSRCFCWEPLLLTVMFILVLNKGHRETLPRHCLRPEVVRADTTGQQWDVFRNKYVTEGQEGEKTLCLI